MSEAVTEKKVVGYVRSTKETDIDSVYQSRLIMRFAQGARLATPELIIDRRVWLRRNAKDKERAVKLGIMPKPNARFFRSWEEMLLDALHGKIGTIIVDRKERLYRNLEDKELLDRIVEEQGIEIFEIEDIDWPDDIQAVNVAAYHYFVPNTRREGIRTANLINDIGDFYEEVESHEDWRLVRLYIDDGPFRRVEFPKLLQRTDLNAIICKYFYHISRKTIPFLRIAWDLRQRYISLFSMEEGKLYCDPAPAKSMRSRQMLTKIAIFIPETSGKGKQSRSINRKRMDLFCRSLSSFSLVTGYYEGAPEEAFDRLVAESEHYDLIVVESFSKYWGSVNELMKCLQAVKTPMCSIKEGMLYLEAKNEDVQGDTV